MRTVKIMPQNSDKWIREVHKKVPSVLNYNTLLFEPEIGEGVLEVVEIQNGLFITYLDFKLNENIKLIRTPSATNDYFILNFHISKSEITLTSTGDTRYLGLNNYSIFLSSSSSESELVLPHKTPIKIFNITFSREWLTTNILEADNEQLMALLDQKGVYLFENIDFRFEKVFDKLRSRDSEFSKIERLSGIIQLLAYFFKKVEKRRLPREASNISVQEIKNLMGIRNEMEKNWQASLTNETLAYKAGMSLSKFKKTFKQVFGTTPYQYYLAYKMEKAMELLTKGEYTVSEVGYLIGYSNLSQFSKVFKKHHSILPKEIVKHSYCIAADN